MPLTRCENCVFCETHDSKVGEMSTCRRHPLIPNPNPDYCNFQPQVERTTDACGDGEPKLPATIPLDAEGTRHATILPAKANPYVGTTQLSLADMRAKGKLRETYERLGRALDALVTLNDAHAPYDDRCAAAIEVDNAKAALKALKPQKE